MKLYEVGRASIYGNQGFRLLTGKILIKGNPVYKGAFVKDSFYQRYLVENNHINKLELLSQSTKFFKSESLKKYELNIIKGMIESILRKEAGSMSIKRNSTIFAERLDPSVEQVYTGGVLLKRISNWEFNQFEVNFKDVTVNFNKIGGHSLYENVYSAYNPKRRFGYMNSDITSKFFVELPDGIKLYFDYDLKWIENELAKKFNSQKLNYGFKKKENYLKERMPTEEDLQTVQLTKIDSLER